MFVHISLELESANAGRFLKVNLPPIVSTHYFAAAVHFFPGSLFMGNALGWEAGVPALPLSVVTLLEKTLNFEPLNLGSLHLSVYVTVLL